MVQGIVNLLEAIVQGLDSMALSPAQRQMFFERGTVPVENSVSSLMPSNERELKTQTLQGFAGSEEIQDSAAPKSGDRWSQA